MVDVRSVSPVLTSGTHFLSISGNQHHSCLQALTKDISTPADIAPSALETIIFYCFVGYISAPTYYLLLLITDTIIAILRLHYNVEYCGPQCLQGGAEKSGSC